MAPKSRSLEERFWPKVNKLGPIPSHRPELGPCWVWTANVDGDGYGKIRRGGQGTRNEKAHRVAWELTHGGIPEDQRVLHHCDNPPCVHPEHLFLGTEVDNAQDAIGKGRWPKGERHSNAKLTNADVAQVRQQLAAGVFQRRIAAEFGVSQHLISLIKRGLHR